MDPVMIFFVCSTVGGAMDVAYDFGELVSGVSSLPTDCEWVEGDKWQRSVQYMLPIDAVLVNGIWYSIAKVQTNSGARGYSAGKPFTS